MDKESILKDIKEVNELLLTICMKANDRGNYKIEIIEHDITMVKSIYPEKIYEIVMIIEEELK